MFNFKESAVTLFPVEFIWVHSYQRSSFSSRFLWVSGKGIINSTQNITKSPLLITFDWLRLEEAFENHSPLCNIETNMLLESSSKNLFTSARNSIVCVFNL